MSQTPNNPASQSSLLSDIWQEPLETELQRTVCFRSGEPVSFQLFRQQVQSMTTALNGVSANRFCLVAEQSLPFAVGLLACLSAGKTVILPPNSKDGSVALLEERFDAVLSDQAPQGVRKTCFMLDDLVEQAPLASQIDKQTFEQSQIELFTSGSSGERKCVKKCLSNFESEIAVLEKSFGTQLEGCTILSSVPHQHIYGLLFKILWPLSAKRPFEEQTAFYPDALSTATKRHTAVCLIASPAHLKRFCEIGSALATPCRWIFSSGGMLPFDVAQKTKTHLGVLPLEVLGSTESGGVATRQQTGKTIVWKSLPGVALQLDQPSGCLQVTSAFVGPQVEAASCILGDGAKMLSKDTFQLLPRRDRICKVEDKRFAPADMEARLQAHALLEEAAVAVLQRQGRTTVAAAIRLSPGGRIQLADRGRKALTAELKEYLSAFFDSVLLPRQWRIVRQLPSDQRGKLQLAAVEKLFSDDTAVCREPELLEELREATNVCLKMRVPDDLSFCEGHFPGRPIVPGFVQLDWATKFGKRYFTPTGRVVAVEALKFQNVLQPKDGFELRLDWNPQKQRLAFELAGSVVHASGRILFTGKVDSSGLS